VIYDFNRRHWKYKDLAAVVAAAGHLGWKTTPVMTVAGSSANDHPEEH
jgi:hypothetical protein